MYGAVSLVGWSLLALFKLAAGILRLTWWIAKSTVKGVVSLLKLAKGTSRKISIRAQSKRGINDIKKIRQEDMRSFDRHSRQYGIYYAVPRGQKGKEALDVLILHNDIPQIERIFEKMHGVVQGTEIGGDAPTNEASQNNTSVFERVEEIKKSIGENTQNIKSKGDFEK